MSEPAASQAQTGPPPLLEARAVTKHYVLGRKSIAVLRGVDLTVEPGEFVAVQGASGAGKSTLLHLLGGLDAPTAGEIWIGGALLGRFSAAALCRFRNRKVGFVFQAYHLLPELSALENVCLPARMARVLAGVAEATGRRLLERVGLAERVDHRPYELSGGEQQRVAIARALINDPALVLADEPTGNLDSRTGGEIINLLCELRAERQATLIIATHDASVAARAPRVMQLADGRVA
jgi:ABC-type lipoprotein export system ATPase subunit